MMCLIFQHRLAHAVQPGKLTMKQVRTVLKLSLFQLLLQMRQVHLLLPMSLFQKQEHYLVLQVLTMYLVLKQLLITMDQHVLNVKLQSIFSIQPAKLVLNVKVGRHSTLRRIFVSLPRLFRIQSYHQLQMRLTSMLRQVFLLQMRLTSLLRRVFLLQMRLQLEVLDQMTWLVQQELHTSMGLNA